MHVHVLSFDFHSKWQFIVQYDLFSLTVHVYLYSTYRWILMSAFKIGMGMFLSFVLVSIRCWWGSSNFQRYYSCNHCLPGGSRYVATDPQKTEQFSELKILAGHDRGLSCKRLDDSVYGEEKALVSLEKYFGRGKKKNQFICWIMYFRYYMK